MKILGLAALLLAYGCGRHRDNDKIEPAAQQQHTEEPRYDLIYQTFEDEHERSVTIDSGKNNERSLVIKSRFPNKESRHGSEDRFDSIAFIDYEFTPHRTGEPFKQVLEGASLSRNDFKEFYFRIGSHSLGKGYDTTNELLLDTIPQVDPSTIKEVDIATLPILLVDLGNFRHYFYRIANHRSLQIVIESRGLFSELDPNILQEINNTLASLKIVHKL